MRNDELSSSGRRVPKGNHESDTQQSDQTTGDHGPLVLPGESVDSADHDTKDGQAEGLSVGRVGGIRDSPTSQNLHIEVDWDPRHVEGEEVEEANHRGEDDVPVEDESSSQDGSGSQEPLVKARGEDADASNDEESDDMCSRPALRSIGGNGDGNENHGPTGYQEEESTEVNVVEEFDQGSCDGDLSVWVDRGGASLLCLLLAQGQGKDDGSDGDGDDDGLAEWTGRREQLSSVMVQISADAVITHKDPNGTETIE